MKRLAEALRGLSPEARRLILETGTQWMALWGKGTSRDGSGKPIYFRRKVGQPAQELVRRGLLSSADYTPITIRILSASLPN
jgi:hypothetical protein